MKRIFQAFLLIIIFLYTSFGQCIVCKSAVESARQQSMEGLAKGVNTGILYLLPLPYLLVVGIGIWWYRNYKKKQKENI